MKVRVIKEHPQTKKNFPLGFITEITNHYSEEDKKIDGFWTLQRKVEKVDGILKAISSRVWVEDSLIPKGTYKDSSLIDINGGVVSCEFFYRATGRSFSEFLDKIE